MPALALTETPPIQFVLTGLCCWRPLSTLGGVRVASFLSGGFLPARVRGTTSHALIATADWYATFAALAGVDPTDERATAHDLPPIDSVDQSGILLGTASSSLRVDIVLGGVLTKGSNSNPRAIISSRAGVAGESAAATPPKLYKLLLGSIPFATWCGPRYPNASSGGIGARNATGSLQPQAGRTHTLLCEESGLTPALCASQTHGLSKQTVPEAVCMKSCRTQRSMTKSVHNTHIS